MTDNTDTLLNAAVGVFSVGVAVNALHKFAGKDTFSLGKRSKGNSWWK